MSRDSGTQCKRQLLLLRTELYAEEEGGVGEEEVDGGAEDEDEDEEEEEGQHEAQELQGKLAFDMITSEDICRHILTLYT